MVLHLSAAEFFQSGLELAGFNEERNQRTCAATNLRRFNSFFGASPESCSAIFMDLQTTGIDAARINKPRIGWEFQSC